MEIFLIIIFSFFQMNQQDIKCWNSEEKLEFDDFQGTKKEVSTGLGMATAVTDIIFKYKISLDNEMDEYTLKVCLGVNRNNSWMQEYDSALLEHEQSHFDIAELYSRKLRKTFNESSEKDIHERHALIKKVMKDYQEIQNKYDNETAFGNSVERQKKWDVFLIDELNKFEQFSFENCQCE